MSLWYHAVIYEWERENVLKTITNILLHIMDCPQFLEKEKSKIEKKDHISHPCAVN